ncbi:MAG: NAD(+) diphosphatase [Pseudomonadota bacterium]
MFHAAVTAPATAENPRHVVFYGDEILLDFSHREPCLLNAATVRFAGPPVVQEVFLGYWHDRPCFAVALDTGEALLETGLKTGNLFSLVGRVPDALFALAGQAQQLITWARRNQYCGQCGAPNEQHPDERAYVCEPCAVRSYPRISPCVIALVHRGNELLLARNANFPGKMFSTLAGFIEVGESVEDCLHREIREEVGVSIGKIEYFGSQPWPFPDQLMLGFFAEYSDGDIVCDEEEIAEAHWFSLDELPNIPPPFSIAGQLIRHYVDTMHQSA